MLGTMRWNVAIAIIGCLLTFVLSIGSNGLSITFIRSLYALGACFVLAFGLRFVLHQLAVRESADVEPEDDIKGAALDLATPDDEQDVHRLLQQQLGEGAGQPEQGRDGTSFQPLSPPRMVSVKDKSPEELAEVVRHLKDS